MKKWDRNVKKIENLSNLFKVKVFFFFFKKVAQERVNCELPTA